MLAGCGTDIVFAPANEEMYPAGAATWVEVGAVAEPLEGQCRPGHFRGVATVVLKLFNMVQPDAAYFGQKDYQQAAGHSPHDGRLERAGGDSRLPDRARAGRAGHELRNRYLSPAARQRALVLWKSLQTAAKLVEEGQRNAAAIAARMREVIETAEDARIDYVALVDPETLQPVDGSPAARWPCWP